MLKDLHDELDAAVLQAYGWDDLMIETQDFKTQAAGREGIEQQILTRLVALNHERAAEEKRGLISWLRPDYQNPQAAAALTQRDLGIEEATREGGAPRSAVKAPVKRAVETWPARLPEQVALVKTLLAAHGPDPTALSAAFGKANKKRADQIEGILETLRGLGLL